MEVCCQFLKSQSRRYLPQVPEADQSDALIEFSAEHGWLVWLPQTASYCLQLRYCPRCGTELATLNP